MAKKTQWVGTCNTSARERYRCPACERDYQHEDVASTWKCPACAEYVNISAENEDTGARITLVRKAACEVQVGDMIPLPLMWSDCYQVLAVNKRQHLLGIAMENYGEAKWDPYKPVNVRDGSW